MNNAHRIVFIDKILVQYICYLDQTYCFLELILNIGMLLIEQKQITFGHWESKVWVSEIIVVAPYMVKTEKRCESIQGVGYLYFCSVIYIFELGINPWF